MSDMLIELMQSAAIDRCGNCDQQVLNEDIVERCQLCGPICRACSREHDYVTSMPFHKRGVIGEAE